MGGFILIDRYSGATVAAGMISFALHRASTIPLQETAVTAGRARYDQAPAAGGHLVYRPVGRGKIHHREPRRSQIACARRAHHDARRRQCAPWPQPGPRLHRGGPGREHPPRRRSREADDGRGPDRALLVHLAVPRRTARWCGNWSTPAALSRSSSIRRSSNASRAIRRDFTGARWPARSGISPASTRPTKRRRQPELHLLAGRLDADVLAQQVFDKLVQLGLF